MADFETAARPYARAIFELASAEGKLQQWQDNLQLAVLIATNDEMQDSIEQPAILPRQLSELFLSVATAAGLQADADFSNLIKLLAENRRLAGLPAIATAFETLKQEAEGKIEVRVRTAQELSSEQQDRIASSMAKRLGKEVSITTEVDDSLIAGAIVTAGDLVIDGSASGRMDKLTIALNK
ncbi:MAG: F0F1 ATP synthase subunit delta [Gammaproteobacteria bacterium]|nr:F0F1 ATP synthase subunit delta [Gammaproteobacteria bacterium]